MEMNESFKCTKCGAEHAFTAYVYAHWNEVLTHTCTCGAKHDIQRGNVIYVNGGNT